MRIARVAHADGLSFVGVHGEPGDRIEEMLAAEIRDHPFGVPDFTGRTWSLADVRLLSPILPSKVIGIANNDASGNHGAAIRAGDHPPLMFLKPSSAVIGPHVPIRLPSDVGRVDVSGSLAVVVGTVARGVTPEQAESAVLGYTVAVDVTARDEERADGQWARAKGHDTFCPLGPWLETTTDVDDVPVTASVNGEPRRDGRTEDMLVGVPDLIAFVSSVMTLLPGDVILTGTLGPVGPVAAGDSVSVTIGGIGTLTNPVEEQ